MASLPVDEYTVAFWMGVAILMLFAWNQFNSPSYPRGQQFARILELLRPVDLRSGEIFLTAYLVYLAILTLVYWLICTYAPLQFFSLIGLETDQPGATVGAILCSPSDPAVSGAQLGNAAEMVAQTDDACAAPKDVPKSPLIPLTVSLAIVGIVPNIKLLGDMEEKVRFAAHRVAGIPAHLLNATAEFARARLSVTADDEIPGSDLDRIHLYVEQAKQAGVDPVAFKSDLSKIFGFRTWVIEHDAWPTAKVRNNYHPVEEQIRSLTLKLVEDLDLLSGQADLGAEDTTRGPVLKQMRDERWREGSRAARDLAGDIGGLLMVYCERAGEPPLGEGRGPSGFEKLGALIHTARQAGRADAASADVFINVLLTSVIVAGLCGAWFGQDGRLDGGLSGRFGIAMDYAVTALVTYGLATLVAVSYQQERRDRRVWRTLYDNEWTLGARQLIVIFALAFAAAFVCLVVYNIGTVTGRVGSVKIVDNWWAVVISAVNRELAFSALGAIFAVFVTIGIDRARLARPGDGRLSLALFQGLLLAVWAMVATAIASEAAGAPVDMARTFKSGATAGLIGVASALVIDLTMRSKLRDRGATPDLDSDIGPVKVPLNRMIRS